MNLVFLLTFALVILIIWNIILTYLYVTSVKFYKNLKDDQSGYSLHEILQSLVTRFVRNDSKLKELEQNIKNLQTDNLKDVSGVGFLRYNPFEEVGSNQSFSLALLNRKHDGVVLSSLHGRSGTRIYLKPVKNGDKDAHEFSEEEKKVILIAKNNV